MIWHIAYSKFDNQATDVVHVHHIPWCTFLCMSNSCLDKMALSLKLLPKCMYPDVYFIHLWTKINLLS